MCRPQLVRENVIEIVNGRHLLQEVASDRPVIPNDTHVPEV
jgi:DNA mismatch repair ATPase MutS